MPYDPENANMEITINEDETLFVCTIDLTRNIGLTKTRKHVLIASTGGIIEVGVRTAMSLNFNLYRAIRSGEEELASRAKQRLELEKALKAMTPTERAKLAQIIGGLRSNE